MKKLYVLLFLFTFFTGWVQAQTAGSNAVAVNNIGMWNNNDPVFQNQCLSSVAAQTTNGCAGAMTDVAWMKFTVPTTIAASAVYTASVKITVDPVGFDAIIEFFTGPSGAPVYKQCANSAGSGVREILRTDPTIQPVAPGTEYYVRVSSTTDVASGCFNIGIQYYAGVYLRSNQSPNPSGDTGLPGYKVNSSNLLNRNVYNPAGAPINNVQSTRWRLVDTALPPGSPGCSFDVAGAISSVILTSFSCVCYGKSYQVYAQPRYEGHWAGETLMFTINMEAYPSTAIINPAGECGAVSIGSTINSTALASTAQFEYEWCIGGACNTALAPVGNSQLITSTVPCIKFGRTYSVRVRASYCGVWGEWSAPKCIVTRTIPYTQILTCPSQPVSSGSVLVADFVTGSNSFSWVFAPVNINNPLVPIGPAIVATTTGSTPNAVIIGSVGLSPGKSYRVQVKARNTACGSIQEGDYGTWCVITMGGSPGMAPEGVAEGVGVIEKIEKVNYDFVANRELDLFNLVSRDAQSLTFNVLNSGDPGSGTVRLMNISGQVLSTQPVAFEAEEPTVNVSLPSDLPVGVYLVQYESESGLLTERIMLD